MLFRKLTDAANYMPWLILALIAGVSIGYFGQAATATHLGTLLVSSRVHSIWQQRLDAGVLCFWRTR